MKCIKLNDHFYVVNDSEIKEGEWFFSPSLNSIISRIHSNFRTKDDRKITHSSERLEGVEYIPKSEFEKAIYGYSVEELAEEYSLKLNKGDVYSWSPKRDQTIHEVTCDDYTNGFNKALELNKDKVFTVEDIRKAISLSSSFSKREDRLYKTDEEIIEILLPQNEFEIEISNGKVKLK